jgi:uncharacterized cysteine cluster protein YcgN (CxxCxxCC family)
VKDLKLEVTKFASRKAQKPMERSTWVGVCSVCGKAVRQFAKGDKKEVNPEEVKAEEPAGPVIPPQ